MKKTDNWQNWCRIWSAAWRKPKHPQKKTNVSSVISRTRTKRPINCGKKLLISSIKTLVWTTFSVI